MSRLRSDLALAVRQLPKTPGFTTAVVLTLALGIGVTSTAFSFLDALFWRPLPGIDDPDRLGVLYGREGDSAPGVASYVDFRDLREFDRKGSRSFSGLAAFKSLPVAIGAGSLDVQGRALMVTEGFFRTLGTRPALGRFFVTDAEDTGAVVLGHDLWTSAFDGSPDVLGRKVLVRGIPLTVVGVAPEGFRGALLDRSGDVFVSMSLQPQLMGEDLLDLRGWSGVNAVGRLAAGVTDATVQTQLDAFAARLARDHPRTNRDRTYLFDSLDRSRISPGARASVQQVATVLSGAVLAVLLIACANVAGLLTVRAARRTGEVAIRSALGAPRAALLRQLLIESLVLAALGALAALVLAWLLIAGVSRLPFPFPLGLEIDLRVFVFTGGAAVVCGLLLGLVPAVRAARRDLSPLMHRVERPASARLRGALVVTQAALSLALLLLATLLLRTVMELREIPIGFDTRGVVVAEVGAGQDGGAGVYSRVLERMRSIPGVETASVAGLLPGEDGEDRWGMRPEGTESPDSVAIQVVMTGERYFESLGVPVLEGRDLRSGDDAAAPPVALVNRSLVESFWPGRSAVGRRIALTGSDRSLTVVGVVEDTRVGALRRGVEPVVFVPFRQAPETPGRLHLVMSTELSPPELAPAIREATTAAGAWTQEVRTLENRLRGSVAAERAIGATLGGFGFTALALVAIGLYGLLTFVVGERRHEIGVRMALGADAGRVRRLVVRRGLTLTILGMVLGLWLGTTAAGALEGLLYGVGPLDPVSLVGSCLVLLLAAVSAAWIPAARAAALDPVNVLRDE